MVPEFLSRRFRNPGDALPSIRPRPVLPSRQRAQVQHAINRTSRATGGDIRRATSWHCGFRRRLCLGIQDRQLAQLCKSVHGRPDLA